MDLSITEPATTLTDYLMAVLAIWFAVNLGRRAAAGSHLRWWSHAFALLAVSSLAGGTFHGFQEALSRGLAVGIWRASLLFAAFSSFATMRAVALQWLGNDRQRLWMRVAALKLTLAAAVITLQPVFLVVIADFGCTMLFAASAGIVGRARSPGAAIALATGIALFVTGAVIQQAHLSPHAAFNHNDLFHAVQILGNACFFLSARFGCLGTRR